MSKHTNNLKLTKLPDSVAEITGELTVEYINECRSEALKSLNNSVTIPGFREGHVPEDVLVKKIGEVHVLEETAEVALGREYAHIIEELKLSPIGRPTISITKLVPNAPLEFKIKVSLEPEFALPDYKKISKEAVSAADDLEVTDKEIFDVVEEIKKQEDAPKLEEGETLGQRPTGEALEGKVKESLLEQKKFRSKEKRRLTLVENLVKATEIDVPKLLIDEELAKMLAQFKDDVEKMGMNLPAGRQGFDAYLKESKKTEEEIKTEWSEQAKDRVKAEMIVGKIASEEKIEPTAEEVEHESKHVISHYPEADPLRVRIYVYSMIRNQKVLEFLEGLK
jgi:FKBP-type peptidyl-prolyl cis-trans isomerase (trigger factor)